MPRKTRRIKKTEQELENQSRGLRKILIGEAIPDIYSIYNVANEDALSYQDLYIDILETMFSALVRNIYFEKEAGKNQFLEAIHYLESFSSETLQQEETTLNY